ncbi:MAG: type II secretion system protein GspN [Pseudomonadota bacterium]
MMKYKIPGYILFFIACVYFSVFRHFPIQMITDYIQNAISKTDSHLSVQIQQPGPLFPWGMKAQAVQFGWMGEPIVQFEKPKAMFDIKTVFNQDWQVNYQSTLLNGLVSGVARLNRHKFEDLGMESKLENVVINKLDLGKNLFNCKISGLLNGNLEIGLKKMQVTKNQGDITIANLEMEFLEPVYTIKQYSFSSGKIKFNMAGQNVIQIQECNLKGRQMDIDAKGDITIAKIFEQSRLNIQAQIILYPLFFMDAGDAAPIDVTRNQSDNAVFNIKMGGTVQTPLISIIKGAK